MANRRQRWRRTGLGAVTAALLLSGLTHNALGENAPSGTGGRTPAAPTAPPPSSAATPAKGATPAEAAGDNPGDGLTAIGAFTDSGAEGVRLIPALENWLGGTELRVGHTYLPGENWDGIEGGGELLTPWAAWKRADPDRLFVLNVPMQANNEDHIPDDQVRALIRAGVGGAHDAHFTRLAQHLVRLGVPDAVIVLGWEMNGTTYTHRCAPDPAGWKTYWNRVVTAMRAVPGQHFRFDFAPNRGQDAIGWTECYPGDGTVDIIGMDSYDQPPGDSFFDQVTQPYGLQAQVDFAAEHHKPISYPEWGLFRNGDHPDYISLMLGWIAAHKPLYQTITDYCPHGVWQCKDNPKSSAVFRATLKPPPSGAPTPTPVATATPTSLAAPTATAAPTSPPTATLTPTATPTPK